MDADSAYRHHSLLDFKDKEQPLFVDGAGAYRLAARPGLPSCRPRGRMEYQLLYVACGEAHFTFQGREEIVPAGNMVLCRPGEEQRSPCCGADHTEIYWVRFTGNNVKNILKKYGIPEHGHVIPTGTSLDFKRIYLHMIQELKLSKPHYEEVLAHYLELLLITVSRLREKKPGNKSAFLTDEMDRAVAYFHSNCHRSIQIEEYARKQGMSVSWFIRNFKAYTGSTPAQYLLSLRISNAQNLLESTAYNVAEIAAIVGYDNPLYFSRLFKKRYGQSPSEFRKQSKRSVGRNL